MKYVNANDVLPEEILSIIQKYYQGGYLYIPKVNYNKAKRQTDYKIELEKRNQHIYLKHLEGRTNRQLGNIYHLSESSIRRIIFSEKARHRKMKEILEQTLPLWGIEIRQLLQIYPSAWEINHSHVIKIYDNQKQLERNIKISTVLSDCGIPVADIIPTRTGDKYAAHENTYFLLTKKLQGNNISDRKDRTAIHKMGYAIAQLHTAFLTCEKQLEFWDNSLLKEMDEWVRDILINNEWQFVTRSEYTKAVETLTAVYDSLPKQLIHRDAHFGNFLFFEGNLSGYIDFDLSQRNIRIFDICYFLAGLLAEETDDAFTKEDWLESVKLLIAGYESIIVLSPEEKSAIPCVMECIEILCAAYFIRIKDRKRAQDAAHIAHFIQTCENDILNAL